MCSLAHSGDGFVGVYMLKLTNYILYVHMLKVTSCTP